MDVMSGNKHQDNRGPPVQLPARLVGRRKETRSRSNGNAQSTRAAERILSNIDLTNNSWRNVKVNSKDCVGKQIQQIKLPLR